VLSKLWSDDFRRVVSCCSLILFKGEYNELLSSADALRPQGSAAMKDQMGDFKRSPCSKRETRVRLQKVLVEILSFERLFT
jgi:hypothetical protein